MATYTGLDVGFDVASGVDLSARELRFISLDSVGDLTNMASAASLTVGVIQRAPRADGGEGATVRVDGITKVEAAGALPVNTAVIAEYVSATDQGKALALPGSAGTYRVRGIVIGAASAEGEIATIRLVEYLVIVT